MIAIVGNVSIPFKREGVSQAWEDSETTKLNNFVSIPFKREGVSQDIEELQKLDFLEFQFPSNGKVYHKGMSRAEMGMSR